MSLEACIEAVVERLVSEERALAPTTGARAHLGQWLSLLKTWNARIDLTAAKTDEELADVMLADALVLAARIAFGARVVDVGSGAGAPGLAIALVRPDLKVTLVEPLNKRLAFLRTVLGTTGRTDVRLERAKGEDAAARGERWSVGVSRATLAPAEWLALGAKLVESGGDIWVLLAREDAPTLEGARLADEITYTLPHARSSRRAVRYVV